MTMQSHLCTIPRDLPTQSCQEHREHRIVHDDDVILVVVVIKVLPPVDRPLFFDVVIASRTIVDVVQSARFRRRDRRRVRQRIGRPYVVDVVARLDGSFRSPPLTSSTSIAPSPFVVVPPSCHPSYPPFPPPSPPTILSSSSPHPVAPSSFRHRRTSTCSPLS
jgi:hypothetical protein